MESGLALSDYDYVIYDSDGRRGVKDGKEYPITEEEWRKAHPEHKNSGCKECSFVSDKETIFTYFVNRELKTSQTIDKPIFVGKFYFPKWTGHSGFYLFKCEDCENLSVDQVHVNSSGPNLHCQHCGCYHELNPVDHRDIIINEGLSFSQRDVEYYKKYHRRPSLAKLYISESVIPIVLIIFFSWLFGFWRFSS